MTKHKSYAECKIANPDSEIVTTSKDWNGEDFLIGSFKAYTVGDPIDDTSWVICNPADYCSSLKEFLEAGYIFSVGDFFIGVDGEVISVRNADSSSIPYDDDYKRYILSAAALNGGCKIPDKAEQWSVYNNTMPLCELSDEQAAMLFNAWRSGIAMEKSINDQWLKLASLEPCWIPKSVYRIKPKSDRELFIDGATEIASDECETERIKESIDAFIVKLFDSGKFKYIDNTQHFGESI